MVDGMLKFNNCAGAEETHTHTVCVTHRVQARSRGGRWCWTINSQGAGEIKRREVVLDHQLTGSRRDQEEGGGAGPSTYRV